MNRGTEQVAVLTLFSALDLQKGLFRKNRHLLSDLLMAIVLASKTLKSSVSHE